MGKGLRVIKSDLSQTSDVELDLEAQDNTDIDQPMVGQHRILSREMFSFVTARVIGLGSSFVVLGIAAGALSPREFGVFSLVTAGYGAVSIFDFGIGSSGQYLSTTRVLSKDESYVVASLVVSIIVLVAVPMVVWCALFQAKSVLLAVASGLALACVPLSLVERWRAESRQAWIPNTFNSVASVLTAIIAIFGAHRVGVYLALVPITFQALVLAIQVNRVRGLVKWQKPLKKSYIALLKNSPLFFLLQMNSLVIFQADLYFLAAAQTDTDLGGMPVTCKIIVGGCALIGSAMSALWPHLGPLAGGSQFRIERRRASRVAACVSALLLLSAALAYGGFGQRLMMSMFGHAAPSVELLAIAAVFLAVFVQSSLLGQIAISLGRLRIQTGSAAILFLLKASTGYWVGQNFGAEGLLLSTIAVIVLVNILPLLFVTHRAEERIGSCPS